jgi:putative acetyltransferase
VYDDSNEENGPFRQKVFNIPIKELFIFDTAINTPVNIMGIQNIILRRIEERDNTEIAELIRSVFREFKIDKPGTVYYDPTTDDLYSLFKKPGSFYWLAEENKKITGGCGVYATPELPEGCGELVKLYLLPEHRGRGIGRMLIEKTFDEAKRLGYKQLYLESMPELSKAIGIYEKAGFRFIPSRMGNSGHFCCDIWMIKDLI